MQSSSSQIVTTNEPTPNFLQARCPSCHPTNSVKALKGNSAFTIWMEKQSNYRNLLFSMMGYIAKFAISASHGTSTHQEGQNTWHLSLFTELGHGWSKKTFHSPALLPAHPAWSLCHILPHCVWIGLGYPKIWGWGPTLGWWGRQGGHINFPSPQSCKIWTLHHSVWAVYWALRYDLSAFYIYDVTMRYRSHQASNTQQLVS